MRELKLAIGLLSTSTVLMYCIFVPIFVYLQRLLHTELTVVVRCMSAAAAPQQA